MDSNGNNIMPDMYKSLKRRFYILISFSCFTFVSGFLFNVWQPILESLKQIFNWDLTIINMLSAMYAIVFLFGIFPFIALWNYFGMKVMYKMSVFLLLLGNFLRLYPGSTYVMSILIQVSNVITAIPALMALTGFTVISSLWFPGHERARATSFCFGMNAFGNALSPIIASTIVPYSNQSSSNITHSTDYVFNGVKQLNFIMCSMSVIVLLLMLIYFPSVPPILPAKSSNKSLRIELLAGLKLLSKNRNFWLVFFANFVMNGVAIGQGAVFTSIILTLNITQKEVGLLNTTCSIFIVIATVLGGWIGDHFPPKKVILIFSPFICLVIACWGLQNIKLIPYDLKSVYVMNIVTSTISSIPSSILFEMGCESAFPVSEEVSTAILSFGLNLGIAIFILITMIPNIGVLWIPFAYAGLTILTIPAMLLYEENFNRRRVDIERIIKIVNDDDDDEEINGSDNDSNKDDEPLILYDNN